MENEKIENSQKQNNENKYTNFLKDKKNIIIIILSFLLVCSLFVYGIPNDTTKYESQINNLNTEINNLSEQVNNLKSENDDLNEKNQNLENEKKQLEEQKFALENEKNELTQKVNELSNAKTSSSKNTSSNTNNNPTSSNNANTNVTNTSPSNYTDNSEMVWVGETGNKYHKQSCRTLKGKGHQITMKQAIAEGREACKVCH